MSEVVTSSYNPVTGERREYRQNVAPKPPDYGMASMDRNALAELYRTQKIEDAEKAVAAAIQFQGMRGYQEAIKGGKTVPEALTEFAPMMFYSKKQALGPSVRALTPPAPPAPMIRSAPGGEFVQIDPQSGTVKQLRAPTVTPRPEKFSAAVGVSLDPFGQPSRLPMTGDQFNQFMATAPPELKTNSVNMAISNILKPAATNAPATPKTKRLRWNLQTGDFDP